MSKFKGLAIVGRKCSGKDTIVDHILKHYPDSFEVVRCKQPIVDAFEQDRHENDKISIRDDVPMRPYTKTDDLSLIKFSKGFLKRNPLAITLHIDRSIRSCEDREIFALIPDIRLLSQLTTAIFSRIFILKLKVPEYTLRQRCLSRDGNLDAFLPNDISESGIADFPSNLTITNEDFHLDSTFHKVNSVLFDLTGSYGG